MFFSIHSFSPYFFPQLHFSSHHTHSPTSFISLSFSLHSPHKLPNLILKNPTKFNSQHQPGFISMKKHQHQHHHHHHHLSIFTTLLTFSLLLQTQPTTSDPNDEACLTQLFTSLQDPTHSLKNWTLPNFSNPCNGFDSHLTGATCNNGRIFRLSLSSLSLHGTISPSLSKCTNLQTLDLSSNSISGEIPSELKDLSNLAVLNLSGNRLSGEIPPTLYLCAYLNIIDLHGNLLSGTIPQQLGLLVRLTTFNVAYNKLSGMIPPSIGNRSGNLPRFNATSFRGNKELYGYPLEPYKNHGLSVGAIVGIGLGSGLLSLIVSFTVVCIWLKVSEQKSAAAQEGKISHIMPDY